MSAISTEIEKYDRAVFEYLTSISDKIIYAPTSSAVKLITKRENFSDNKPWNFLSFYRDSSFDINWNMMNNPDTVAGSCYSLSDLEKFEREAKYIQTLPVDLSYSVEIWASKATEAQEMALSLISKIFMQEQVLKVPLYPDDTVGRFHILNVSWNDNSDLERETEIGKIYRHTVEFTIDARLTLLRERQTTKFCCVPIDIYEDILSMNEEGGKSNED